MNCPRCNRPAEESDRLIPGGRVAVARCRACRLAGVVGSSEPWLPTDGDPFELMRALADAGARVEGARAGPQVRYRDLETK